MEIVVELGVAALVLGLTYTTMSEGLWGAALIFFNVLFASVLAFNFYEPVAALIASNAGSWSHPFADVVALIVLFLVIFVPLRLATDSMAPTMVRFPTPVFHAGRVAFGLATGVVATGYILLIFHAAPVHKKIFNVLDHDTRPPFGLGLDHRFLALVQHTTGYPFSTADPSAQDPFGEFEGVRVFDPEGRWLIDHEDARPFGEGWRDEAGSSAPASTTVAPAPGGAPGMPAQGQGPGIPGGTGGAAVGLAPQTP